MSQIPKGYKLTDVGVIPEEWEVVRLSECCSKITDGTHDTPIPVKSGAPFLTAIHVKENNIAFDDCYFLPQEIHNEIYKRCNPEKNDVLMVNIGAGTATTALVNVDFEFSLKNVALLKPDRNRLLGQYLNQLQTFNKAKITQAYLSGGAQPFLSLGQIASIAIQLPPKHEQEAIAGVLSDADALIEASERLIAKKRLIKQGAMQHLLTPKPDWEVKKLGEIADCLDNLRVPLNDSQRTKMKGNIPYCGANGIVDYVDDYVIDDDIILMAEDGGYFDEYKTRPIAYRMTGKCWVNNHAHILKAKDDTDQGFLFYSLVHKNILDYINGGTRAKLNKSELVNIQINTPKSKPEQTHIASILSDMDEEISALEAKLSKERLIKEAMMQNLLTGKVRLV